MDFKFWYTIIISYKSMSAYSLSLLSHLLWTQVARTWVGQEGHFSIDIKAYVTILKVTSWFSYGFDTTNKIPSSVDIQGGAQILRSGRDKSWEVWVCFSLLAFADLQGVSSQQAQCFCVVGCTWWASGETEQPSHVLLEADHPKPQLFWQTGCMEDRLQLS